MTPTETVSQQVPAGTYTPTLGGDGFGGTMYFTAGKMTITMCPPFV